VYGSYLDLRTLWQLAPLQSELRAAIIALYVSQLREDLQNAKLDHDSKHGSGISLAGKWLPKEKNINFREFAKAIARGLEYVKDGRVDWKNGRVDWKRYRNMKTLLCTRLRIVETPMCQKQWDTISHMFAHVPGQALRKYSDALQNVKNGPDRTKVERSDDPKRRELAAQFKRFLTDSKQSRQINAHTVSPHEVVKTYMKHALNGEIQEDPALEAMWNVIRSKWEKAVECVMFPLSDTSGSMEGTPMEVSIALGILLSQINPVAALRGLVMTFSRNPTLHELHHCTTLASCVASMQSSKWGMNTDINAAMKRLLDLCNEHAVSPRFVKTMKLVIISDMQFDQADVQYASKLERIQQFWMKEGYPCAPHIVFWNVRSTDDFPSVAEAPGVTLVSGFSVHILNMFATGEFEAYTPIDALRLAVFEHSRYQAVKDAITDLYR
jgi:hypothetical protein